MCVRAGARAPHGATDGWGSLYLEVQPFAHAAHHNLVMHEDGPGLVAPHGNQPAAFGRLQHENNTQMPTRRCAGTEGQRHTGGTSFEAHPATWSWKGECGPGLGKQASLHNKRTPPANTKVCSLLATSVMNAWGTPSRPHSQCSRKWGELVDSSWDARFCG